MQIQIVSIAIFLLISGVHINILPILKVKILFLKKWSYRSLKLCWLLTMLHWNIDSHLTELGPLLLPSELRWNITDWWKALLI